MSASIRSRQVFQRNRLFIGDNCPDQIQLEVFIRVTALYIEHC